MHNKKINVVERSSVDKYEYCLVGLPDVGLVGSIALNYLIQEHQMAETGYLESDEFPPVIVIRNGDPKPPLRLYSKDGVVSVISEISVNSNLLTLIAVSIVDWAKSKGVKLLIAVSGIAVQNRLEIDVPETYGVGSSISIKDFLKSKNINVLKEGFIAGFHAVLMKESLKKDVPCLILLAQSHLKYPDPGAAASLISSLGKLIGLKVDTQKLLVEEEEIRLKLRELMKRTHQQMRQVEKGREQEIPSYYIK